jgi:hypothetical protein
MKLSHRKDEAEKKWRRRAWIINYEKTRIIFVTDSSARPKRVPPWIYHKET